MTDPELELVALAEHQHGLITRRQAREAGVTRSGWAHRLRSDRWQAVSHRVARRRGSPNTVQQRLLAAVLDVGPSAYISHGAAAALWGANGFDQEPPDLIVVRDGSQTLTELARVHRPRHLPDPFGTTLEAIPVVRPTLVLLQLAPKLSPDRLRRLLDQLWTRRLLSGASVARELAGLMHRGRPGTVAMRKLLDSLPDGYVPAASGLEGRFAWILEAAGLPTMRRQVDLGDEGSWAGRVDFLSHDVPLVVEVDSERYHSALTDREADVARQQRLEAAGFVVCRFTDTEVWRHPARVVEQVRRQRTRLRSHRTAAA